MSRSSCVAALLIALVVAPARAEDLATLLAGATAAAHPKATVRGDGELVTTSPDATTKAKVVVLQNPAGDLYFEVQPPGARALILANGTALLSSGADAAPLANDGQLAGSEFSRED